MNIEQGSIKLAEFLRFLSQAHTHLDKKRFTKHHPDVKKVRLEIESHYRDSNGKPAMHQKYESAMYEDAANILSLWNFFTLYQKAQLKHFQSLVDLELSGLTGDYHPVAILGRSVFGTAALVLSGLTFWWGLIKLVSVEESENPFQGLIYDVLNPEWINRIVGTIWLVGLFVFIWYVVRMVRNRGQVAFLSSLRRSLALYLDEVDG